MSYQLSGGLRTNNATAEPTQLVPKDFSGVQLRWTHRLQVCVTSRRIDTCAVTQAFCLCGQWTSCPLFPRTPAESLLLKISAECNSAGRTDCKSVLRAGAWIRAP